MDAGKPASKRELLETLLERGMVMVTLDARRPGVDVPAQYQEDPRLRLNLSYRFGLPLDVNDWGVRATLTFGGVPHDCKIPWSALYRIYSHPTKDQFLFPADVPEDLIHATLAQREEAPAPPQPPGRGRPRFAVVEGQAGVSASERTGERGPDEPPSGPPRRPHLRRIK